MKSVIQLSVLMILTPVLAAAADSHKPEYSCFNKVQLEDGASVSIVRDENGNRLVEVGTDDVALNLIKAGTGATLYEGRLNGRKISVNIAEGESQSADVVLGGLTYACQPALQTE